MFDPPEAPSASAIPGALMDCLPEARRAANGAPWVRAEVDAPGLDAAAWLGAQPAGARGFWSDREGSFAMAGVGRVDSLIGQDAADLRGLMKDLHRKLASTHGNVRYFGGFCFDPAQEPDEDWKAFGRYRFVLPRFEVVSESGRTHFACNLRAEEDAEAVRRDLEKVRFESVASPPDVMPKLLQRADLPARREWDATVRAALECIQTDRLAKVVLARRATFQTEAPIHPAALLARLRSRTRESFHFCFQPDARHAFVGASPERLYRRVGQVLSTEAIAGTRRRGCTAEEDARLGCELLASAKDRLEHQLVVDGIQHSLSPLLAEFGWDEAPSLLKLNHNQHLLVRFRGTLKSGVDDGELLSALHPTPAVGGEPTRDAFHFLRERERFCRGWYAAPIGWVSRDAAQFAVGIRSALVVDRHLHLYSGAGIVEGSDPYAEWLEIENKIGDFLDLFDSEGVPAAPPA